VLRVNEKHIREYYVFNVIGFIITTNHRTDGIYLPADDRRHFVVWSDCTKADFTPKYWGKLWHWYRDEDGFEHVAAYLHALDIIGFDPKAPPPQTPAFWAIVNAGSAPEDAELRDVLDALGNPDAVTLVQLIAKATGETSEWLMNRKNRRTIPHRMERCGYMPVRNPDADDGLWRFGTTRRVIYAKVALSVAQQLAAAKALREKESGASVA
jgi:hypothetical protein